MTSNGRIFLASVFWKFEKTPSRESIERAKVPKEFRVTLVQIVVTLVVAGLVMWLINTYIPMAAAIKSLLNLVVFVVLLIWLLQTFGLIGAIPGFKMPALR